jgi:hypothetical protein
MHERPEMKLLLEMQLDSQNPHDPSSGGAARECRRDNRRRHHGSREWDANGTPPACGRLA